MKGKEFKLFLLKIVLLLFLLMALVCLFFQYHQMETNRYVMNVTAQLVNKIAKEHPELEEELMDAITSSNLDESHQLLEKYGITEDSIESLPSASHFQTKLFRQIFVFLLVGFSFITWIYWWNMRKFYHQLELLNTYIRNILCGRENTKIKDYEEGSFSIIKNDIYKITLELMENKAYLKRDKKYLEETLSDISHQLKTPLTSMYMINDLLENDDLNLGMKHEFLMKNRQQLERIEWLVTSLLKLSKLESGTIQLKKERVLVQDLIRESVSPLRIPIELKNQELVMELSDKDCIDCDINWTREAFINIIKNAYEHTQESGKIIISVVNNPIYFAVLIADTGEGIKTEDILHVFERFYKGKHNAKESIGIGLYMAKNIMNRQNGTIEVESSVGKGTTFLVKFYKIK